LNKRPSLAESMRAVAAAPAVSPTSPAPGAKSAPAPAVEDEQPRLKKGFYAATRVGKKKATVTLSAEAHRQLKLLAVDHGGVEALLTEAINDLFRKLGKQPIA
jgi:hypothetical protein